MADFKIEDEEWAAWQTIEIKSIIEDGWPQEWVDEETWDAMSDEAAEDYIKQGDYTPEELTVIAPDLKYEDYLALWRRVGEVRVEYSHYAIERYHDNKNSIKWREVVLGETEEMREAKRKYWGGWPVVMSYNSLKEEGNG